jgi:hypothetical protein
MDAFMPTGFSHVPRVNAVRSPFVTRRDFVFSWSARRLMRGDAEEVS